MLSEALNRGIEQSLERKKFQLEQCRMHLQMHHPERILAQYRQDLDTIQDNMAYFLEQKLTERKHRLAILSSRLHGLSPLERLSRGFGFVTNQEGARVETVDGLEEGQVLQVQLTDGKVKTKIVEVEKMRWQN